MGALLFHEDFYKAAASYAGCHDKRMDKIWRNEQWTVSASSTIPRRTPDGGGAAEVEHAAAQADIHAAVRELKLPPPTFRTIG
jgi:hypothetical protein